MMRHLRLTIFALFLSALACAGGPGSKLMTAAGGSAPAGYGYLLDDVSVAPWAAYSVRLLKSTYAGACVRLRRVSDDAESDFGFVGGLLDTTSIATWVGGSTARITTWYDQSGNARNAVQATAAQQPLYGSSGFGTIFAPYFRATDSLDYVASSTSVSGCTVSGCAQFSTTVDGGMAVGPRYFMLGYESGTGNNWEANVTSITIYTNGSAATATVAARADAVLGTRVTPPSGAGFRLCGNSTADTYWDGMVAEGIVWTTVLSADDIAACQGNQMAYFGLPFSL